MGEIEWAMWANEQALISCYILFIGAVIGVAGFFQNWQFAAFCLPASILLILLEYPRGKRRKGNTIERRFQHILTPVINKMSPLTTNYFARFLLHLLLSVPCCFLLPTIMGGICMMITSIIYLVAALKGEEWKPVGMDRTPSQKAKTKVVTSQPPSVPPPRAPVKRTAATNETVESNEPNRV